jgi:microcystin-dependent protein
MAKDSFKIQKSMTLIPQSVAPTNPENGDLYYDSVLEKFQAYQDGSWGDLGGGEGTGSGEINTIADSSTATNWSTSGSGITIATTTTTTDLPLAGIITSAIKITPVSSTDYARYRFTMPAALKQRKLKIAWEQLPLSGYASGDLRLEIHSNPNSDYSGSFSKFNLSTDSSSVTAIPNATGRFQSTFDTDNSDYYELRIVRNAGTTALNIANVVVGPGIQPQGAIVGAEWAGSGTVNLLNPEINSPDKAGFVQAYAGATAPKGWMLCNGTALKRADYPALFANIGTTWNTQTNPTTGSAYSAPASDEFRIPDLRGMFLRSTGTPSGLSAVTLGGYQGDTNRQSMVTISDVGAETSKILESGTNPISDSNHARFTWTATDSTRGSPGASRQTLRTDNGSLEARPRNIGLNFIVKLFDDTSGPAVGFKEATATERGLVTKSHIVYQASAGTITRTTTGTTVSSLTTTIGPGLYQINLTGGAIALIGTAGAGGGRLLQGVVRVKEGTNIILDAENLITQTTASSGVRSNANGSIAFLNTGTTTLTVEFFTQVSDFTGVNMFCSPALQVIKIAD